MEALVLVSGGFEVDEGTVEEGEERIYEVREGVVEGVVGERMHVVDVAGYTVIDDRLSAWKSSRLSMWYEPWFAVASIAKGYIEWEPLRVIRISVLVWVLRSFALYTLVV